MTAHADRCQKCGGLWDLHCFLCEPVTLCPVPVSSDGLGDTYLAAPCKHTGPRGNNEAIARSIAARSQEPSP